jgi:hypothetical protein
LLELVVKGDFPHFEIAMFDVVIKALNLHNNIQKPAKVMQSGVI